MDYTSILEQARHYVKSFFDTHVNENLYYHNRYHTEKVVEAATMIAQHYQLNDRDLFIVNMAALFHDIGYLTGEGPGHEERGAKMAESFLAGMGIEPAVSDAIRQCILATQIPQRAVSLLEQIVCDADLFHFGTDEFGERNKLIRKEIEAVKQQKIGKDEWRKGTIQLMEGHHYYTDYARLLLDEKKRENLAKLEEKQRENLAKLEEKQRESLAKLKAKELAAEAASMGGAVGHLVSKAALEKKLNPGGVVTDPLASLLHEHAEEKEKEQEQEGLPVVEKQKKNKKKQDPGRGIDTVFRITSNNNQRLSTQADSKAHILIQVNSIIISVLLSLLLRKIEDHANLAIPTIILLTVNLVTIILSILATRPHIPPGTFNKADLDEKKVNLLFFGNFYKMSLEEYAGGMLVMMDDRDFLYGSLIRDVYFQGIALGNKYRWLRLSYNVFMYGLIGSVLAFVFAALAYPGK